MDWRLAVENGFDLVCKAKRKHRDPLARTSLGKQRRWCRRRRRWWRESVMIKTTLTATVGKISSNNNNNNNNIPRHHLTVYSWLFLIPASKGAVRERDADVDEVEVSKQDDDVKFFNLSFVSPWPPYDWSFFFRYSREKNPNFSFFAPVRYVIFFLFWFVHVSLIWGWFFSLTRFFRLFSCFSLLRDGSCDAKANHPKPNSLFRRIFPSCFFIFFFLFFFFSSTSVFFLFFHCFLFGYFRMFMRLFRVCVFKCQIWVRIKVQISI